MDEIICDTCLSRDRTLVALDLERYRLVLEDTKLALDSKLVCWECVAMFHKLHNFRLQILRAQALLDIMAPQSLSRLKSSSLKSIDVCCDPGIDALYTVLNEDINQDTTTNKLDNFTLGCIKTENDSDDIDISYDLNDTSHDNAKIILNDNTIITSRNNSDIKRKKRNSITKTKTIDANEAKYENITTNNRANDIEINYKTNYTEIKDEQVKDVSIGRYDSLTEEYNIITNTENNEQIKNSSCPNYFSIQISKDELEERREHERQSQKYREYFKFKCEDCIVGFYDGEVYEKHIKLKHSECIGKYQCKVCKVRFPRASLLKAHEECHFTKYRCRLCAFVTYKLSQMKLHDAKEHGNMKFACVTCQERFVSQSALRLHREREHSAPFACDLCEKTFNTRNNLLSHKNAVHKAKRSECHICHEKCLQLPQHMLRKHAGEKHEAYCAECDKRFATLNIYKIHLKLSAKHRSPDTLRYECTQCNAKFVSSTGLKKHILAVHKKVRAFQCQRCDKGFHRAVKLRAHIDYDHDGKERPRDHACHVCDRRFGSKQILVNHVRTHTGERPFACSSCGAAFAQHSALRTHERRIHRSDRTRNKTSA